MELGNCAIERPEGVEIRILLQPRASNTEIVGLYGKALKIRITSPPVDGQANAALKKLLSHQLEVPQQSVQVIGGFNSRRKRVLILGMTLDEIRRGLIPRTSPENL